MLVKSEYEDVLARADLFQDCRLSAEERNELLDIFLAGCEWTRVYYAWRPNLRDVARMKLRFPQIRVVSPEDFLKEIQP